jgi:hypothetical protein
LYKYAKDHLFNVSGDYLDNKQYYVINERIEGEEMSEELKQWKLAHQRLFDEMTSVTKERDALREQLGELLEVLNNIINALDADDDLYLQGSLGVARGIIAAIAKEEA